LVSGFDLSLLFDCRFLHTMVYCEAVRLAILATALFLVKCFVVVVLTASCQWISVSE